MSGKLDLWEKWTCFSHRPVPAVRLEKPRSKGRTDAAIMLATTCSVFDTGGTDCEKVRKFIEDFIKKVKGGEIAAGIIYGNKGKPWESEALLAQILSAHHRFSE